MYSIEKEQFDRFPLQMTELATLAKEMGRKVDWVDKWSGGLLEIDGSYFGYGLLPKFPLNNATSRQLVRDKVYAYMLMEKNEINVSEGDYFFRPDVRYSVQVEGKGMDKAILYAEKNGYPLFVKPNRGALGKDCMKIENVEELRKGLNQIWENDYIAIVQKYLIGKEYRVMFLDGEILLTYEKSKPFNVIEGEKVLKGDVANLSGGGVVVGVVDEYNDGLKVLVKKISDVFDLRYGGIDLMGDDIENIEEMVVLEVNADPGLEGFIDYDQKKGSEVLRKLLEASLE